MDATESAEFGNVVMRNETAVIRFLEHHAYGNEARNVVTLVHEYIDDPAMIELSIREGDFEGEEFLQVTIFTAMSPSAFVEAFERLHKAVARSLPLERRVLMSLNFRVL